MPSAMSSMGALQFSILMITPRGRSRRGFDSRLKPKFNHVLLVLMTFLHFSPPMFCKAVVLVVALGDCIPLTPMQTFVKDLILLVFAIVLLIKNKHIIPISTNLVRPPRFIGCTLLFVSRNLCYLACQSLIVLTQKETIL
jgi:hypothetical protein